MSNTKVEAIVFSCFAFYVMKWKPNWMSKFAKPFFIENSQAINWIVPARVGLAGCRDGAVLRALASHQHGLGLISWTHNYSILSWWCKSMEISGWYWLVDKNQYSLFHWMLYNTCTVTTAQRKPNDFQLHTYIHLLRTPFTGLFNHNVLTIFN